MSVCARRIELIIELVKTPDPLEQFEAAPLPTERLEAEICMLAGYLAATECEMASCAAWLSWKCQIAPGTAREHVRVARALRNLPRVRAEFAAGRLSYSKVRALTRIAVPGDEKDLLEMAIPMTAGQLERFARAYQQCTEEEENRGLPKLPRRSLKWRFDQETGGISFTLQLPPEQAAVVLQALRAAVDDLEHPHDGHVSAQTRPEEFKVDTEDLAEALTEVAASFLRGKIVSADNADIYQVVIHATPQALAAQPGQDVPAETPAIGHPAFPGRCHVEDGPAVSYGTAQLIACDATISAMVHDLGAGEVLSIGRRSRRATAAMRRAVRERDGYRCTFPGCESRRTDLHHIVWWSRGGQTSVDNLQLLCKAHHAIVHDKRYIVTRKTGGGYLFTRPDGLVLGDPVVLPEPAGDIRDTEITAETISKPVVGERLDLHLAIWIALNNRRSHAQAA